MTPLSPQTNFNSQQDAQRVQQNRAHAADGARAAVVNRTHRIVRDEALTLREQRERTRDLWVPLSICSALLLVILYAVWKMLDFYNITPTGIPEASDQLPLMLLWFLPATAIVLGVIWIRRARGNGNEVPQ